MIYLHHFVGFDQNFDDSADPEHSQDGDELTEILAKAKTDEHEHAKCQKEDEEVKLVPGVFEVIFFEGDDFNDGFEGKNDDEDRIDDLNNEVFILLNHEVV